MNLKVEMIKAENEKKTLFVCLFVCVSMLDQVVTSVWGEKIWVWRIDKTGFREDQVKLFR